VKLTCTEAVFTPAFHYKLPSTPSAQHGSTGEGALKWVNCWLLSFYGRLLLAVLLAEAVWKPKSENSKWEIKSDSRIIDQTCGVYGST